MDESTMLEMAKLVKGLLGIDKSSENALRNKNTQLVRGYSGYDKQTGAIGVPIYQSSMFVHEKYGTSTGFGYGRYGNPTRLELEDTLAMLEHGKKAWAYSSGMTAESILMKLLKTGDHVIVSDDLYGGTFRLFTLTYAEQYGLEFSYVPTDDLEAVKQAIKPNTKAIFVETPSNPIMKVTDIQATADLIHNQGGLLIVDNTFLTPYFQTPIDLGADIVVHSGTKFLSGHNDVLSGFIVIKDESLIERIFTLTMTEGGVLGPFDSYLMLRSIKTLGLRLERQQENAFKLFEFLSKHPKVERVYYVGDPNHPQYELSKRQSTGFGSMISFKLKNAAEVPDLLNSLKLILFAESLGGCETFLTYPLMQTHGAIPEELRKRVGVDEALLRLSVGIEDAGEIIADLEQALG
ncbi:MAG: PLP-dependent aspartate aminotransferase family protein [Oscillospiraceae bacterium]|jgi:cystathionine gamma-synthase|nr:PLP-dependent aspartate aminotransferase family protein [Oscillospiraceae bacterium]